MWWGRGTANIARPLARASPQGLPGGSAGKESACSGGDLGSVLGLGRSPGEGISNPVYYSCLENSINCIVHGVAKSQTQLSDLHYFQILITSVLQLSLASGRGM